MEGITISKINPKDDDDQNSQSSQTDKPTKELISTVPKSCEALSMPDKPTIEQRDQTDADNESIICSGNRMEDSAKKVLMSNTKMGPETKPTSEDPKDDDDQNSQSSQTDKPTKELISTVPKSCEALSMPDKPTIEQRGECRVLVNIDDQDNFGLHTFDADNVLDPQGRVLINIGHSIDEPDIFLPPQVARIIKPYQIGGIRFLYDNIATSNGEGCVLAHSMGLGKTLQIVCFCDIFLNYLNYKTVLCIVPINTIENWVTEFNKWLPNDNGSQPPTETKSRNFHLYMINSGIKLHRRSQMILEWKKNGGVLLLGFEMFRTVMKAIPKQNEDDETRCEAVEKDDSLFVEMAKALINTDLIVCDEGHRLKNSNTEISVAVNQVITKRRIVLTGYPLQNNLMEYWSMINFVRPHYLGTNLEFTELFQKPIQNGHSLNASPGSIKLMRYRTYVLHSILFHFVQRRSHIVVEDLLPPMEEYVIMLSMNSLQRNLYKAFVNYVLHEMSGNPIRAFAASTKIWNHPDMLFKHSQENQYTWSVEGMKDYKPNLIENSPKLQILFAIVQETILLGDRLLVFSQTLETLTLIERFLHMNTSHNTTWIKNLNYFRMDGTSSQRERDALINEFNANPKVVLFLLSTKACSHGINLVGANRVVIFDTSWNPCDDQQALHRIYRFQQVKSCFVYRLVMNNCLEKRIYDRQVNKQAISNRVIDEGTPPPNLTLKELKSLCLADDLDDEKKSEISDLINDKHHYRDTIMQKVIEKFPRLISLAPFSHKSLLSDDKSTKLSNDEKLLALREYKLEKDCRYNVPKINKI